MDKDLPPHQQQELDEHTASCSRCRALIQAQKEISRLFSSSPAPHPQPGFTERWISRVEAKERSQKAHIVSITLAIILVSFLFMFSTISVQIPSLIHRLPQLLFDFIGKIVNWFLFMGQLKNIFTPLIRVGTKLIPPTWYLIMGLGLPLVFFAWLLSLTESMYAFRRYRNENAN